MRKEIRPFHAYISSPWQYAKSYKHLDKDIGTCDKIQYPHCRTSATFDWQREGLRCWLWAPWPLCSHLPQILELRWTKYYCAHQLPYMISVEPSNDFGTPEYRRGKEHHEACDSPDDLFRSRGEFEVPAKDVDTVAKESDSDEQDLSDLPYMRKPIVGETGQRPLLRTASDAGKRHYVC